LSFNTFVAIKLLLFAKIGVSVEAPDKDQLPVWFQSEI